MSQFRASYGPRALVLGGSEGIGAAFAQALAARGLDLTLVARRRDALAGLAAAIAHEHGVDVAIECADLAADTVDATAAALIDAREYGLVVYNAGAAHGAGLFTENPVARELGLVRLNCLGPTAFAHHALRRMVPRGRGGLILVSSMSGLAGSGHVATYAAAKSFEIVLAEGLHWENAHRGVDVLCAVASLTDTPAMQTSGMQIDALPGLTAMAPHDVAEGALNHLGQGPVWCAVGQAAIDAARAMPRADLIDRSSRMAAALWRLDTQPHGA
ncbi:SDR family NAD(P)-dependent oxidoreductase [Novosphingobium sp.]|uniref:SDR family NAD(P)-dependent oxidoreductase n=1 Tax=Novosphingobium sp. TaxID=1874826 RepID=UPI0033426899